MSGTSPIHVPVHYDFASTLCYVAHHVFSRIAPELRELEVELSWEPIDLAGLLNWKRGHPVSAERRANAARVARELEVEARAPRRWTDSRKAMAIALELEDDALRATWRERIFSEVFERDGADALPERCLPIARELGVDLPEDRLGAGLAELERRTRAASDATVAGVPTLMLGGWPIGGIQSDQTMLSMLGRYAKRTRERRETGGTLQ